MMNNEKGFVGFEYMEVSAKHWMESLYVDSYENFGWEFEGEAARESAGGQVTLKFKRDRKLRNKAELTRLQRNFDSCVKEIETLTRSKTTAALTVSLLVGILGTGFMAGSVFAVTAEPPMIWLMILLAVPGFIGWILPYFLYRTLEDRKEAEVHPLIEQKYDEIYAICEKGNNLIYM